MDQRVTSRASPTRLAHASLPLSLSTHRSYDVNMDARKRAEERNKAEVAAMMEKGEGQRQRMAAAQQLWGAWHLAYAMHHELPPHLPAVRVCS